MVYYEALAGSGPECETAEVVLSGLLGAHPAATARNLYGALHADTPPFLSVWCVTDESGEDVSKEYGCAETLWRMVAKKLSVPCVGGTQGSDLQMTIAYNRRYRREQHYLRQ